MSGQNTIYFQKFDVNPERSDQLFWHQYMQNVIAPFSESRLLYNAYSATGLLNTPVHLIIPVYENMPEIKIQSPNINPADFTPDNTRVVPNVSGNLNIRCGPRYIL